MNTMKAEELLTHSSFIRSLARSLVADDHTALDLEQQTWLMMLEKPPSTLKSIRSWLFKVVQNRYRMILRKEKRLKSRERNSYKANLEESPDEILAQKEVLRCVTDDVLSLKDPYLRTIMLRFYENHSLKEVASRTGVPLGTVKSRLNRGIEMLRNKLDVDFGGSRRAWCVPLISLAGIGQIIKAANKSVAKSTEVISISTVTSVTKFLISTAIVIGLLWISMIVWRDLNTPAHNTEENTANETISHSNKAETHLKHDEQMAMHSLDQKEAILPSANNESEEPNAAELSVTWRGAVFDHRGQTMSKVVIQLIPIDSEGNPELHPNKIQIQSNGKGAFEFNSLSTGRYKVNLANISKGQSRSMYWQWGEVLFKNPGLQVSDIRFPGELCIICGVVMDDSTGLPLNMDKYNKKLESEGFPWFKAGVGVNHRQLYLRDQDCVIPLDEKNGSYYFIGLPGEVYDLTLMGPGLHVPIIHSVKAQKGQIKDNIDFHSPPMGALRLHLQGFEENELTRKGSESIQMYIAPSMYALEKMGISINKMRNYKMKNYYFLPQGNKTIIIGNRELGMVRHEVEIVQGQETELVISRREFDAINRKTSITINGRLRKRNGSPVQNVQFYFSSRLGNNVMTNPTDADGRFILKRIKPGLWDATAMLYHSVADKNAWWKNLREVIPSETVKAITFHNIIIPEDATDSYTLEMVLPESAVSGVLCNNETGQPISQFISTFMLVLYRAEGLVEVARYNSDTKNRFRMDGIPPGKYILNVLIPGYMMYYSSHFSLKEGQDLDLGSVMLDPTGILELEVVDEEGKRLRPSVLYDGRKLPSVSGVSRNLPNGKTHYCHIPVGQAIITVRVHGYEEKDTQLVLKAGEITPVRIVLKPSEAVLPK